MKGTTSILPDIAPRLPRGKILADSKTFVIDRFWIAYMGKIYGVDRI